MTTLNFDITWNLLYDSWSLILVSFMTSAVVVLALTVVYVVIHDVIKGD